MLSLISALVTPAAQPGPRSVAPVPSETSAQLPVVQTALSATDGFSVVVGTREAADIGALTGARRNAEEGAALVQVADTGLSEISDALVRMKALAKLADTTSYSRGERAIMNAEFDQLRTEIDNIVDRSKFNNIKVLEGTSLAFKVGTVNAIQDSITVPIAAATVAALDAGLASASIDNVSNAGKALTDVTNAIDTLKGIQSSVDGAAVRLRGVHQLLSTDRNSLIALRTELLARPVTMGTAGIQAHLARQEFLSQAAPAAVGKLSSVERALLSTAQQQPNEPLPADERTLDKEDLQPKATKRSPAYETRQKTKPSSRNETSRSVDIKA